MLVSNSVLNVNVIVVNKVLCYQHLPLTVSSLLT